MIATLPHFPRALGVLIVALMLCALQVQAQATATFKGAWFEIVFPADFIPRPSLSATPDGGPDSVFFDAADGGVGFYVYSPQWGGTPTDIALDEATETLTGERTSKNGPITRRWFTISARDGSYQRSYLTTSDERGPSNWTIGIKYSDSDALGKYRPAYNAFRESLQQFAD
jgi:hypothetical protein